MRWLSLSTLKSSFSEQTSEGLQTRSFSYSVSQTYMPIPTKNLLTPFEITHDKPLQSRPPLIICKRQLIGTIPPVNISLRAVHFSDRHISSNPARYAKSQSIKQLQIPSLKVFNSIPNNILLSNLIKTRFYKPALDKAIATVS